MALRQSLLLHLHRCCTSTRYWRVGRREWALYFNKRIYSDAYLSHCADMFHFQSELCQRPSLRPIPIVSFPIKPRCNPDSFQPRALSAPCHLSLNKAAFMGSVNQPEGNSGSYSKPRLHSDAEGPFRCTTQKQYWVSGNELNLESVPMTNLRLSNDCFTVKCWKFETVDRF